MDNQKQCCICSQINGQKENDLISVLLNENKYKRRIALENEHFVVIPSLGALVSGHVLLCPKLHYKSIAQMDCALDDSYNELLKETISILKKQYKTDVHFFEHGAAKNSNKLICTVDHAHLHLVPTNTSIEKILFEKFTWIKIGNSLEEFRSVVGSEEYIFYESPLNKRYIAQSPPNGFESQFMRQVFAKAINKYDNWNWRDNPDPIQADKVYSCLKKVVHT